MVNKVAVITGFIALFQANIERIKDSLNATRKCAVDAPGSNVSRSDTSKFQLSNLALGLEKRLHESNSILELLSSYNTSKINERVCGGSLVSIQNMDTKEVTTYLLITREGGGYSLVVEKEKVTMVSIYAPIGKLIVSKEVDDEITFQGKVFEVRDVQ